MAKANGKKVWIPHLFFLQTLEPQHTGKLTATA